jgi:hypothetical protein
MKPAARGAAGFALIVVLWFLVLLSVIGIYMLANARSETAMARNTLAAARAEALADGAIADAAASQMLSDPTKKWRMDGTPYHLNMAGGDATLRMIDESQKINPNLATDALMSGLFQALGQDRQHADSLGAAIADWVQSGDDPRPLGAKKEQYAAAGRNYGPPGQPVESLDDLQLVLGMTPQLLAAALPYLTIYTAQPSPTDPRVMSPVVLKATKTAAFQTNGNGQQPDDSGQQAADSDGSVIMTAEVTAHSFDGGMFVRRAVIAIKPNSDNNGAENPRGFQVMDWRRGVLSN